MKKRKLLKKVLSGAKNVTFDELKVVLQTLGFELKRVSGSHHIYKHPSIPDLINIQPNSDGKVKSYQVRQLLKLVETYNLIADEETSAETPESNEESEE
jgi:predicted RNA binding protein YcfA (HicA-like mRNA interferase family)